MTLKLRILRRAARDAQQIFDYIKERSPQGAVAWWTAFNESANSAAERPLGYGLLQKDHLVSYQLQQALFKTRNGRVYRFMFTVVEDELRILRVRGPGQPGLETDELLNS